MQMQIELPKSEQVELMSISAMLNESKASDLAMEMLNDSDFFHEKPKMMFSIIKNLSKKGESVSCQSVYLYIKEHKLESNLDLNFIMGISQNHYWIGTPYEEHFSKLKNLSSLRKIIACSQEAIISAAKQDANCQDVIDKLQKNVLDSQGVFYKKSKTVQEMIDEFQDERSFSQDVDWRRDRFNRGLSTSDGISTGYPILDDTLGYFQKSCIYYIGARTSMGKTTFMNNLIRNMLKNKVRVGVFSLEMANKNILSKIICVDADVMYCKYFKGDYSQRQSQELKDQSFVSKNSPLFIDDEDGLTIGTLISRAKRMMQKDKIEILFIDHLTRIKSDTKYPIKHLQVEEISKGLQSLAKMLEIPVVCLAQLNRQVTTRPDNKPYLADFKESGSIEEDADGCILLHRPEYYDKTKKPGVVEVNVAKNRIMGTLRNIEFFCDARTSERYHERREFQAEMNDIKSQESELDKYLKTWQEDDDE